jgi:hypothetical protein
MKLLATTTPYIRMLGGLTDFSGSLKEDKETLSLFLLTPYLLEPGHMTASLTSGAERRGLCFIQP